MSTPAPPAPDDPFLALRIEAGFRPDVQEAAPRRRLPHPKKPPKVLQAFPGPLQGPRLADLWETEDYDPASFALYQRVDAGENPGLLILGAGVRILEGERYIILQNPITWWTARTWLIYPLPATFGVDHFEAVSAFTRLYREEMARRLGRGPADG